jgi:uncharacterized membrane protein YfcA
MPTDSAFWFLACLAAFLVGASKGGLPGVGILAVPVLAQRVSPVFAAGMLLPVYIISDVYGLWIYRKSYDVRNIKIILPAAIAGILVGWALASHTSDNMVKLLVAAIGISYFVDMLLKSKRNIAPKPADVPRGIFWGTLAGFTSFVAHSGGPPFQMYALPQKMEKMVFAGTSTIIFTAINLLKLPPYWFLGQVNMGSIEICAILAPVSIFGAWAGYHLTRSMPEKLFFKFVETALLLLSLKLIYDVLKSWM